MDFNQSNSCWCGEKHKIISSLLLTYEMLTAKSQANLFIPNLCGISLSKQFSCREERSSIWILMKHWGACAVLVVLSCHAVLLSTSQTFLCSSVQKEVKQTIWCHFIWLMLLICLILILNNFDRLCCAITKDFVQELKSHNRWISGF